MRSRAEQIDAERRIEAAVRPVIARWLDEVRAAFLYELATANPGLVAAAFSGTSAAVDNANAALRTWNEGLSDEIMPEISIVFGEAFQRIRRADEYNSYQYEQDYLLEVESRLKIWPDEAFEDIRPELLDAMDRAESFDEIKDRVGRILNIDAPTRHLRQQITEIDEEIKREGPRSDLKRRRRELWKAHDASLGEWEWKARRIARTEAHGARETGQLAAARQMEQLEGSRFYKRWLATADTRTRPAHVVADGQTVRIGDKFTVGDARLDRPGDPTGPPEAVIQCRCTTLIFDEFELQDELQGPDGSSGAVTPGGIRLGPDDPVDVEVAIGPAVAVTSESDKPGRDSTADVTPEGGIVGRKVTQGREISQDANNIPANVTPLAEMDLDQALAELEDVQQRDDVTDEYIGQLMDRIDELSAEDPNTEPLAYAEPNELDEARDPDPIAEPQVYDIAPEAEPWAPDVMDTSWPAGDEDIAATEVDKAIAALEAVTSDPNATDEDIEAAIAAVDAAEIADAEYEQGLIDAAERWEEALRLNLGDHEEAAAYLEGISVEEVRKRAFVEEHYRLYGTRDFNKLARLVFRDHVRDVLQVQLEAATTSHVVKPQYQDWYDTVDLWMVNEATFRKYASKEAKEWFDVHGRTTPSIYVDMILSGDYRPRRSKSGGDYNL